MKICVTGGHGFIGRVACQWLVSAGHEVVVLDSARPTQPHPWTTASFLGDVRDKEICVDAFRGCDRVLHLAAAHRDFGISETEYFDVNQRGTAVVCEAMVITGIRELCLYSSVAVYGSAADPRSETTTPSPLSPYGKSKLAAEMVAVQWAQGSDNRHCLIMRPTVVFGPESTANMYSLIRQIHRKRFLLIGKGSHIKSLAYVDNVVAATMFLWGLSHNACPEPPLERHEIFNYADKPDLSVVGIVDAIYHALHRTRPTIYIPMWFGLVVAIPFDLAIAVTGRNLPISSSRIRKLATATAFSADKVQAAGFQANVTLTDGIAQMVEWYGTAKNAAMTGTDSGG